MNSSHRDHLAQIFSLALCAVAGLFAESAPPLLKVAAYRPAGSRRQAVRLSDDRF